MTAPTFRRPAPGVQVSGHPRDGTVLITGSGVSRGNGEAWMTASIGVTAAHARAIAAALLECADAVEPAPQETPPEATGTTPVEQSSAPDALASGNGPATGADTPASGVSAETRRQFCDDVRAEIETLHRAAGCVEVAS